LAEIAPFQAKFSRFMQSGILHRERMACARRGVRTCAKGNTRKGDDNSQLICSNCGTIGKPKTFTKGSILIEIFLWFCFLLPGLLYSIWRLTTRTKVCRSCGAKNMVPLNSPMGKKLQNELGQKAPSLPA
jgi:hypothetical protein